MLAEILKEFVHTWPKWSESPSPTIALWSAGLSALTGEGTDSPGSERCAHRGGQEQERCCDQGKMSWLSPSSGAGALTFSLHPSISLSTSLPAGGPRDAGESVGSVQEWDRHGKGPEGLRAEEGGLWHWGQHQEGRVGDGLSAAGTQEWKKWVMLVCACALVPLESHIQAFSSSRWRRRSSALRRRGCRSRWLRGLSRSCCKSRRSPAGRKSWRPRWRSLPRPNGTAWRNWLRLSGESHGYLFKTSGRWWEYADGLSVMLRQLNED